MRLARGAAHRPGIEGGAGSGDGRRLRAGVLRAGRGRARRAGGAGDGGRLRDPLRPRAGAVTPGRAAGGRTKGASMTGRRRASAALLVAGVLTALGVGAAT